MILRFILCHWVNKELKGVILICCQSGRLSSQWLFHWTSGQSAGNACLPQQLYEALRKSQLAAISWKVQFTRVWKQTLDGFHVSPRLWTDGPSKSHMTLTNPKFDPTTRPSIPSPLPAHGLHNPGHPYWIMGRPQGRLTSWFHYLSGMTHIPLSG